MMAVMVVLGSSMSITLAYLVDILYTLNRRAAFFPNDINYTASEKLVN